MGGFLEDGKWITKEQWESGGSGEFERQESAFRDVISAEPGARFAPERERYHLYVSYACPWAHRVLVVRALMGLEEVLPISVVNPFMGDEGWSFEPAPGVRPDPIHGAALLREVYLAADPKFTGRVTVPVLWDCKHETIVNNESRDIIRMLSDAFAQLGAHDVQLAPKEHRTKIDAALDAIYEPINNGVYRCGFAGTQDAYESAHRELFSQLARWEGVLAHQRYLCGEFMSEADVCMFTTLLRFDPVYYVHFKCCQAHIYEHPNLSGYLRELYQTPGVASTVNMDHIREHYFTSHPNLNPKRFVPPGPIPDLGAPHERHLLAGEPAR